MILDWIAYIVLGFIGTGILFIIYKNQAIQLLVGAILMMAALMWSISRVMG